MTKYIATIQEGHAADRLRDELSAGLERLASEALGDDTACVEVRWKVIPRGFGWTAGRPSNSSVLLCLVPDSLPFLARAEFMTRVNNLWIETTGADSHELLIFTTETTL